MRKHFNPRLTGEELSTRRITRGPTLVRQWEKVEVMRKTVNLRTTMRMVRGLDLQANGQEQNGKAEQLLLQN